MVGTQPTRPNSPKIDGGNASTNRARASRSGGRPSRKRIQPAVSARIQSLENDLGKTLIDRTAPSFRLTDQGIEVADFALQFLNLRETMNTRLLDKHKQLHRVKVSHASAPTLD